MNEEVINHIASRIKVLTELQKKANRQDFIEMAIRKEVYEEILEKLT
jgi:hypothetical protein